MLGAVSPTEVPGECGLGSWVLALDFVLLSLSRIMGMGMYGLF